MSRSGAILGEGALTRDALSAANIHPETGLATDYLNHFNEVVMLIDMLPDMPELCEDVLAWRPCGYVEHFQRSGFAAKALAIEAYGAAPRAVRAHLETLIAALDHEIASAQALAEAGDPASLEEAARLASEDIRPLIQAASGAIHGNTGEDETANETGAQAGIDALFG